MCTGVCLLITVIGYEIVEQYKMKKCSVFTGIEHQPHLEAGSFRGRVKNFTKGIQAQASIEEIR